MRQTLVQVDADFNLKKAVERKGTGARERRGNRIPLDSLLSRSCGK